MVVRLCPALTLAVGLAVWPNQPSSTAIGPAGPWAVTAQDPEGEPEADPVEDEPGEESEDAPEAGPEEGSDPFAINPANLPDPGKDPPKKGDPPPDDKRRPDTQ